MKWVGGYKAYQFVVLLQGKNQLLEKGLLKLVYDFPMVVSDAAESYSPALIANYCYELVKEYNQFYHGHSIIKEEDTLKRDFRLILSGFVGTVVQNGMDLLGIEMPDRM